MLARGLRVRTGHARCGATWWCRPTAHMAAHDGVETHEHTPSPAAACVIARQSLHQPWRWQLFRTVRAYRVSPHVSTVSSAPCAKRAWQARAVDANSEELPTPRLMERLSSNGAGSSRWSTTITAPGDLTGSGTTMGM